MSDRVGFILDRSGSMRWPHVASLKPRMEVAQSELSRVLASLPDGTRFNVLAFDSKVFTWRKSEATASTKVLRSAAKWVGKQESKKGAYTNTYGVLERAFAENPSFDTMFLVSDGIPEYGEVTCREGLLAAVDYWNRYRRVTINTIAITHMRYNPGKYPRTASMGNAEAFMRTVASQTGGGYTLVTEVPK